MQTYIQTAGSIRYVVHLLPLTPRGLTSNGIQRIVYYRHVARQPILFLVYIIKMRFSLHLFDCFAEIHCGRYRRSFGTPGTRLPNAVRCGAICDMTTTCAGYTLRDDGYCVLLESACTTFNDIPCYDRSLPWTLLWVNVLCCCSTAIHRHHFIK